MITIAQNILRDATEARQAVTSTNIIRDETGVIFGVILVGMPKETRITTPAPEIMRIAVRQLTLFTESLSISIILRWNLSKMH